MPKYIELIDKYRIEKSLESEFSKYAPPDYIWTDNTGEIIRCGSCVSWSFCACEKHTGVWYAGDYCSKGERKDASNS